MTQSALIRALQRPEMFPHAVESFKVRETHISWVLLTGPFAYKIKKPVDLGFLDFSTRAKRRYCCEEELRLNQRLSPQLYVEVVPICGTVDRPRLGGPGDAIEYAVKMVEFSQENQLDRVLERGALRSFHIDALADTVAEFHARIPSATEDQIFGAPERLYEPVEENFLQIRPTPDETELAQRLQALETWSLQRFQTLHETFIVRQRGGFVRECHGDMHLGNMALLGQELVIFDCIEFSENLRWINVMSEIAFLTMDLEDRGCSPFAWRFLNRYLEATGDYQGLQLLRFYQVYRAMVRAKVAHIRMQQEPPPSAARAALRQDREGYVTLAHTYTRPDHPVLIITYGLSGSGKTTATQRLLEAWGAVRVRSDVERKRLFGLSPLQPSRSGVGTGLYTREASQRTYERLAQLARCVLEAGFSAIVDATFLGHAQRQAFRDLALSLAIPFTILSFEAPDALLQARVAERARGAADASEADLAVLAQQACSREPLTDSELARALPVPSEADLDVAAVIAQLQQPKD